MGGTKRAWVHRVLAAGLPVGAGLSLILALATLALATWAIVPSLLGAAALAKLAQRSSRVGRGTVEALDARAAALLGVVGIAGAATAAYGVRSGVERVGSGYRQEYVRARLRALADAQERAWAATGTFTRDTAPLRARVWTPSRETRIEVVKADAAAFEATAGYAEGGECCTIVATASDDGPPPPARIICER